MTRSTLPFLGLFILPSLFVLFGCQREKQQVPLDCFGNDVEIELPEAAVSGALVLVSVDDATHIAVDSGDWSDACVWSNGEVPDSGARVLIPEGVEVQVDGLITHNIGTIGIYGTLSFATDADTELRVHTLVSPMSGTLEVGTIESPVAEKVTARIVFTSESIFDENEDPKDLSRGAILMGPTKMHGHAKTHRSTVAVHPSIGDTTINLSSSPNQWAIGDSIVIAGTEPGNPESDEQRLITNIEGTIITLNEALDLDHVAPEDDLAVHVANLTRNIEIISESTDITKRGHIMLMNNLIVDMQYVRFDGLGRTNKRIQVDDWYFPDLTAESAEPGPATNIRGRYSVHFHRGGVTPTSLPARVEGCVVEDNPGWAYVNHSSTVDFINNVSYDVVGGAFQTEAGDEQGSFVGNIAIRTINPDYPIENPETAPVDIRESSQDFAFQGDGFWIHGGGIRLEDNVATGSSGHGFIFWTEGLREEGTAFDEMNRFMTENIPNGEMLTVDSVNAWWVPVAGFTENQAYTSNRGLALYYIHTTLFEDIHDLTPAYLETVHSTFENLKIWNVGQMGIHIENSTRFTFRDVHIVNNNSDAIGIHTRSTVGDRTIWDNISVSGFETGMVVPTQGDVTIRGGTWSNYTDFYIVPPQFEPGRQGDNRDLLIEDVTFEPMPAMPVTAMNVKLAGAEALNGELAEHNEEDAHRLILVPDRIVLSSNIHDRQRLYFDAQASNEVPVNSEIVSSEAHGKYLDDIVDQTNATMMDTLGLSFAGALTPSDASSINGIDGGVGAPIQSDSLPIPACLFINEAPPPADIFDTFNFYDCWNVEGGLSGTVSPFDHTLD